MSCTTVGPDYSRPEMPLPATFAASSSAPVAAHVAPEVRWWTLLGDTQLDAIIARASSSGLDVRSAFARLRAARALRGLALAERHPNIDLELSYGQSGESENTQFGQFVRDTELWSTGFDATWELDLWGRISRQIEAADAEYQASVDDLRATVVSVAAETARSYVELRAFQQRLALARQNLALQEATLALVQGRFEAGLVGERDLAQAQTVLESTRALLPTLELGQRRSEHRLALLCGQSPAALAAELQAQRAIPLPPAQLAIGLPADLLRRRADIRRAERLLAAATARIGLAEAELYPRLTLSGSLGLSAEDVADLFERDSTFFRIGPSLRWNIFDASRRRWGVELQDARTEEAHAAWEQAVLLALEECENALVALRQEELRQAALAQAAAQARRAVELAETQYREGLSDFQIVLDSTRALTSLEDELAASRAALTLHAIALYKALGGGWEHAIPDESSRSPAGQATPVHG